MGHNVQANPGSGGATFGTNEVAGVHIPLGAQVWGALGTANLVDDVTGKRLPVKIGEALPAGTNNIGHTSLSPTAALAGLDVFRLLSANSTNSQLVKSSAGRVYGFYVTNTNANPRYLKLYNKASAPTVGTDTPKMTILIPGNTTGAGAVVEFAHGIEFSLGIGLGTTTGVADNDSGAVAANEMIVNLFYK